MFKKERRNKNLNTTSQWTILWTEVKPFPFHLDEEATGSTDPEIEKSIQETSSNLTLLLNRTTSSMNDSLANEISISSRRRRRGIGWRGGSLDWWYGNWCGPYQGGYTRYPNPSCRRHCTTTSYVSKACRSCLPAKDGLDAACMEHDRW